MVMKDKGANMDCENVSAIIWDFDSTLADTKHKNMNVTKRIIERVTGREPEQFSVFNSLDEYFIKNTRTNWRVFYADAFAMNESEINEAGCLWTEYQKNDETRISLYSGIADKIKEFANIPHGVFSMNSKDVIKNVLSRHGILEYFHSVVGYEEVGINQKPKPDGLLMCIEELGIKYGIIFYIGDMECDALCAVNANKILNDKGYDIKIVNICSRYDSVQELEEWSVTPDYVANSVEDIAEIIKMFNA